MKNEKESKEKVHKSSSSTSEVLESIDLTLRPTSSIEPHILPKPFERDNVSQITETEIFLSQKTPTRPHIVAELLNSMLNATNNQLSIITTNETPTTNELCTVHQISTAQQIPTTSGQQFMQSSHEDRPGHHVTTSQPNMRCPRTDVRVYRSAGGGIINSTSAMHNENYVRRANSKISLKRVPPSYSTVLKLGAPRDPIPYFVDVGTYPSIPYIARQPPPSYAEVHGGWDENPSIVSADSITLGPNPVYVSCPRCRTIVISDTHSERSHLSYITSLIMCLFMCWPCCLLPFCVKACRNTYHFCPTCHFYLGVYRPC